MLDVWQRTIRRHRKCYTMITLLLVLCAFVYCVCRKKSDIADYTAIRNVIEMQLRAKIQSEKGTGCIVPYLDPFAPEVMKLMKEPKPLQCKNQNWAFCENNVCRLKRDVLKKYPDIYCIYRDILFYNDVTVQYGQSVERRGPAVYNLVASDYALVDCYADDERRHHKGVLMGVRKVNVPTLPLNNTYNILMIAFDSTSKNSFIRSMPKSFNFMYTKYKAITLNSYNIVGDGTPQALLPMLTGFNELELPDMRKRVRQSGTADSIPFIWKLLKKHGYETAYGEDMPSIGTFQYRFNGFKSSPTDHYMRTYFTAASANGLYSDKCVNGVPTYKAMMRNTFELMTMNQNHRKFVFTFIAEITHDMTSQLPLADYDLKELLSELSAAGVMENTVVMVLGDHGARYSNLRHTYQGKQEERLPLMSIILPRQFDARLRRNMEANANTLTTPYDIHATLLDLAGLGLHRVNFKYTGSNVQRSISLFTKVPKSRSCSEAGIETHWCTCLSWNNVSRVNPMYQRVAHSFVDFINNLTQQFRSKCEPRYLKSIGYVLHRYTNEKLLSFQGANDTDGFIGAFNVKQVPKDRVEYYQIEVRVGPGDGIYEASIQHNIKSDTLHLTTKDISRINAYSSEPHCISETQPELNMYCYCREKKH